MKTDKKTVGFGGGITNARTVRPKRCAAPVVQMRRCENARMAAKKDARPKRQLRTGVSNCRAQLTEDSIARIEEDASTPENRGIGRVYRRQMLPVAPSASKAEAEAALRRVMSREARCPHGHR